jgi:hypothetical protein
MEKDKWTRIAEIAKSYNFELKGGGPCHTERIVL